MALLMLSVVCLKAQVIKGRITDAGNGRPVANASVYLNGTYKGTASDNEGNFTLQVLKVNNPLVVSCVGYQSIEISNYGAYFLNIKLIRKTNRLPEVTISFGGLSREEEMKIFLEQFIGSVSKDCTIENPDDIVFTYHKKTNQLIARSDKPLMISNKKLG